MRVAIRKPDVEIHVNYQQYKQVRNHPNFTLLLTEGSYFVPKGAKRRSQ